ncbi:ABC transporter substrate-binding protein [Amycolatopsis thermophila]|uniref:Iron complex transport system substrate-binding protein n=1 Tax=Amycolatopsis thermophila TaxID=206084 RepID=A0ABU0EVD5_9PSEU|nr:ABC transporter substrate-binding protein [Amycolatopsis thermophila]MDQ0379228.1 iron complex transport system substrate-binding protein [Amycolatopsis thermophila]
MTTSRRTFLTGSLAVAATGLLAACGSSGSDTATAGGAWTFTDDLGTKVDLDAKPARIAGLTDAIASLWNYGITPAAAFGYTAMADDVNFRGRDLSGVKEVGRTYGEIDIEALAAAKPDLILTHAYPVDSAGTIDKAQPLYGFKDITQQHAVAEIAPIIALKMAGSATNVVDRTVDLVRALGGEPPATAEQDYDAARDRLKTAAAKGLTVMAIAAYPGDGVYIAKAGDDPALRSYTELGLTYPDPGGSKYYWEQVSWENIGKYATDVVLYSLRAMDKDTLLQQPTFARMPAAAAGQVFPWEFSSMDYVAQARTLNNLAANLEASRKVV